MGVTVGAASPIICVMLPFSLSPVIKPSQSESQTLPEASTLTWPDCPELRPSKKPSTGERAVPVEENSLTLLRLKFEIQRFPSPSMAMSEG